MPTLRLIPGTVPASAGKDPARVATNANVTLAGGAPNTVDGVLLVLNNRVLVKSQSSAAQNGIYVVSTLGTGANGTWTRATDMNTWNEVPGAYVFIQEGTLFADTGWYDTANQGGTLGVTAINWQQFAGIGAYTAGTGITLTGTQFSLTNPVSPTLGGTGIANNAASTMTITGAFGLNLTLTAGTTLTAPTSGTLFSTGNFADQEVPSGAIDGVNTTFTLAHTPIITTHLYRNGLLQSVGMGNDYTISGNTITFSAAPDTGNKIVATYNY